MTLAGSVALVTGAARPRGIGRGVALALARDGADVAVNDIGEVAEDGAAVVREIEALGRRGLFVPADVSRRDQVDGMFAAVEADMGPVGIVCSNAGVADWQAVADLTPEVFRRIVDVNLTGAFHVCQAAARLMADRGGGRIVVTSSVHVQMPFPQMSVYGSTKQALRALVDHMAVELGPHAVTVNHVGPGWVKSYLNDRSPSLQTPSDEAATLALIPAGRPGTPDEMGEAVRFLASEEAGYVTGTYLRVDGGFVVGAF